MIGTLPGFPAFRATKVWCLPVYFEAALDDEPALATVKPSGTLISVANTDMAISFFIF